MVRKKEIEGLKLELRRAEEIIEECKRGWRWTCIGCGEVFYSKENPPFAERYLGTVPRGPDNDPFLRLCGHCYRHNEKYRHIIHSWRIIGRATEAE
jgi:hypothetical protein